MTSVDVPPSDALPAQNQIDARLVVPAVACWGSAWLLIAAPQVAGVIAVVAWATALVLILAAILSRRNWLTVFALGVLAVALCGTSIGLASEHRVPALLAEAAKTGRLVTLTIVTTETVRGEVMAGGIVRGEGGLADVDDSLAFSDGAPPYLNPQPYAAVITGIELGTPNGVASGPASSPVMVFGETPPGLTGIGVTLTVRGTITAADPGDRIAFLLFATGEPHVVEGAPWFLAGVNSLREEFSALTASLPGAAGDLLPGLSIGDTSAVSDTLDSAMKVSSLSHLTAVSGANCAVVIGIIMLCGGLLRMSRGWRITASIVVLLGFVVLVTPEPSVLRASVMALVVLIALAAGRPVRGVSVLCFAVIVVLVEDPWLARSYGFVLSVLATGGLIVLAGPLARRLAVVMPAPLAAVIAVPLAAQLACQPVLILLSPAIPVYGVVANLLAGPAAPAATVLGLLACVLLPVVPWFAEWCVWLAWLPSAWVAAVALFFSGLPGAQAPWPPGVLGLLALSGISIAVLAVVFSRRGSRQQYIAGFLAAGVIVLFAAVTISSSVSKNLARPPGWQIAVCDVGQGDAMLVRSAGMVALIDTGAEPALLETCLAETGVHAIDLLVLTHFDFDHVGGATAVMGAVTRVIHSPPDGARDERLLREFAESGAQVDDVTTGVTGILGELRWNVVFPSSRPGAASAGAGAGAGARDGASDTISGNDASVVMVFSPAGECVTGCLSSIFLGDLGERAQDRMRAAQQLPRVDVVKVGHHGSGDQSAELYERLAATVGVIGVGAENTYGHPTHSTLDLLATTSTHVARTDLHGLILLAPGEAPGDVVVWTQKTPAASG